METIPNPEFSEEERELIRKLKEHAGDPATLEAFRSWYDLEILRTNALDSGRANAEFTLKRARILLAAGLIDEAYEELLDLRDQADGERADDLSTEAKLLLERIEDGEYGEN